MLASLAVVTVSHAEDAATQAAVKSAAVSPEPRDAKWWTDRHAQKLAAAKAQDKIDLLMVGDSITHGWEGKGKEVFAEFYADRNPHNIGFSGDRTEHVLWRFDHGALDNMSPKLAVLMIGTNNVGHRKDPSQDTADGIKLIVEKLREKLPETKVLILGIFPRSAAKDDEMRKLNDGTNEIIKDLADGKNVFYLNINDTFLTEDGVLTKEVMPDLLHPHAKGYRMWAEAVEPTIAKLMGDNEKK
ncbi:platelet-activating factor acetylhydrolase IB subunit [Blastopirellula sp. J2-11]|uniref:platelet-activating factor acetylhydrolase IB subunit n=1 Tax=Blastopirellula sp. J2-11 TaxID=2943192 RepID=UPI0021C64292|nr:platelet-activating factor acetylhydrolase IB subunit [Blastopirellula sp. J2-11]UUO06552.1 platelet-activating factor acetylhydrolase IB subunit [Blastopirellula sp. J2-11]